MAGAPAALSAASRRPRPGQGPLDQPAHAVKNNNRHWLQSGEVRNGRELVGGPRRTWGGSKQQGQTESCCEEGQEQRGKGVWIARAYACVDGSQEQSAVHDAEVLRHSRVESPFKPCLIQRLDEECYLAQIADKN
eukprot:6208231-Pleurochrysis_carterae.AAC.2